MSFPLYVTCCFSLTAFNILSLHLVFFSLIDMCLHISPWVYPVWDSVCLLDLIDYFLFHVGEIFNYNLFKNFPIPFLFLFFFWDPYNLNVGAFNWYCARGLWDYPQFFSIISLYSALQKLFPPFYLPAHWFNLLLQIFFYWFLLEYF